MATQLLPPREAELRPGRGHAEDAVLASPGDPTRCALGPLGLRGRRVRGGRGAQRAARRGGGAHQESERARRTAAGATALRVDALDHLPPDLHCRRHGAHRGDVRRLVAPEAVPPDPVDGDRLHDLGVAGPDHELGALCGLQPPAVALAGDVALGVTVPNGRTVHRRRLRDVLPGALFPGDLGIASPAAQPSPSTRSSGGTPSSLWPS